MKFLNHNLFTGDITVNGTTTLSTATGITRSTGDNTTHLATTAFVKAQDYATNTALGNYVPLSRTLTINNVTYDLSANRSWTIGTSDYTSVVKHAVKAGVAITKGQAIYVTSADGTNMIVGLASNTSEATSSKTMGLAETTVATNGFTNVVTEGLLAGLNTVGANAGDPVWLGTGGNLIYGLLNKPYAPAHLVFIGIVTRVNANNGEIFVKVQNGFELKEIHDVDLITVVPVNGHLLGYNGTLWVNKTIAGWLGYTPANASGTTNYVSKFTGTTALGNSQIFDDGTNVGIGTTDPTSQMSGTYGLGIYHASYPGVGFKNSTTAWLWYGQGSTFKMWNVTAGDILTANTSGNIGIGTTSPGAKLHVAGNAWINRPSNKVDNASCTELPSRVEFNNAFVAGSTGYTIFTYPTSSVFRIYGDYDGNLGGVQPDIQLGLGYLTVKSAGGTIGNVGIGTTSPLNLLHVSQASANTIFRLGNNASYDQFIYFNGGNDWSLGMDYSNSNAFVLSNSSSIGTNDRVVVTTAGKVGIGTSTPAEELHVIGRGIFNGGSGNSSQDAVVYITKSTNDDWGLYVNNAGLDYGMYTRVSPSASYAIAIHNGTSWTTRITGNAIIYLGEKNAIEGNYDSWLRLNNSSQYASGVYTPGVMRADGGFNVSGSTVWHAGNDGAGSGLDADLLDGYQSSTSSTANTIALRDSVGDISAREFVLTASTIHTTTPSSIVGIFPTTNQVVKFADTAVRTFLNVPTRTGGDASGTWGISISGNADTATNLIGLGSIQSTSIGTSYQNNYQVRENSGGGSNTNEIYAPQLAFHWSGVVASSIMMEASGRIAIRNNPGGSYENFAAAVITATGGNSTNWNTAYGWGNHASAGYLTSYTETDTLATVTARGSSTNGSIFINGVFTGGLGAVTTDGTLDWNDVSNARAGQGYTLLLGTATNGMGGGQYYHPVSFEYSSKNGSGNMTQLAIPYTGNGIWYRNRYGGSWSSWARVWDDSSFTSTNISNWNTAFGWGNHASQSYATQTYVNTAIANLVDSAPATLDTLNELAAALGDDPNFATTVATSIGTKQNQLNGTGFVKVSGTTVSYDNSTYYLASNPSGFISSYTETDTLATVTGRGASTSTNSVFTGGLQARKNQTDNSYTTAALWTESYGNTTTGIAFHISGNVGKFLEMRTNGILYWDNAQVWTAGTLTNLNQLTNGPGYITGYTETDTLNSVTGRGNTTSNSVRFGSHVDLSPTNSAFRFYDGSTFRGGLGLDDWAHSGSAANITAYVNGDNNFFISTSGVKRAQFNSGAAIFRTYSADNAYNIRLTGGDQINAYYNDAVATLHLQYHNGNGGTLNVGNGKLTVNTAGSVVASGDMRAPIFYDSNDTNYYLDLSAATSSYAAGIFRQNDGKFVRDSHHRTFSGFSDYYPSGNAGWYRVAEITLTTNCAGAVLFGTLYDHRYDGADAYQVSIVARAECGFTSNNESHYINVGCTILGSTNHVDYKSKIRVVLSASSAGSRTYEVQFYETAWNQDTWQLETTGWTIYTTPQAPRAAVGTPNVYYVSNQNADYQRANTATYSPVYYDSDDTTYYADFNSTSGSAIKVRGGILTGPNPSWSQFLQLGGDGNNSSHATVAVTNGNLHIDAKNGSATYINHYYGNKIHLGSGGAGGGTYTHSNFSLAGNLNLGGGDGDASHRLQVIGNALVQGTQGFNAAGETASLYIGDTASEIRAVYDGGLDFYQNSVHRVRIEGGTGNFGIGTSDPNYKLHVVGNAYINETLFVNQQTTIEDNLLVTQGIGQNNLIGRPAVMWSASGTTTGAVMIKFPGGTSNYGMVHAVVDIYEYSGNTVSTIIIGGHNWNGAWYSYGANLIGQTDKQVRLAVVDGAYAIVIGDNSSSWSYGQVVLRKIQNGGYYQNIMNVYDGYIASQTTSLSASWISGDLRGLIVSGVITASGGNSSNWNTAFGWGNHAGLYQPLENQRLSTTNSPTFSQVYADNWFRNNQSNEGLYNEATTMHWSSQTNGYWDVSSTNTVSSIRFYTGGHVNTLRGYVYANSSNEIGFLNSGGNWGLRMDNSYNTQIYGHLTVGSGTSSDIYMTDTDETTRRIHCNSNRIGFLNSSNGWGSWAANDGSWYSDQSMRAPIFYDSADTSYYVDPNSYSRIYRTSTHLAPSPGVGSSNWVNDFNATPTSSMSFGGDLSSGGPQGTWWFQQNFRHSNASNYWGTQVAWGWEDNANELWQRNVQGGSWSSWVRYINTNNYAGILDARYYTETEINNFFSGATAITGYNKSNWDTAYGWGNHAGLYAAAVHNHDDRYYTESESDSRFVNVSGDTMNGSLSFDAAAVIKKKITGVGDNPVKTASGVLASRSDNGGGYVYYVIETTVPQDNYQMGGFTIELFGAYGSTNNKTKIDLGGYWNPESNSGFQGFEAHGTNPQYKPTIEVARNSAGNTAFIIYGVSWSYPVIVARDLWLGYNSTDPGTYGEGWTIAGTNDVSSYTNKDTVIWRNAYSDSNPAGYITGYTETDTLATVTGRGASTSTDLTFNGTLTMGTGGTQYIRMGRFPGSVTNTGEAWIGRASDRSTGTMTVQLGSDAARIFEIVDHAWSTVIFSAGMNAFSYKGNTIWHAGNLTNLNQLTNGPGYITGNQTITLSGDVSGSGTTSIVVTVNNIDGWGFVNTGSNSAIDADSINSNGISYYNSGVTNFSGNATDGALYSQRYSDSWQHQIAGDYRSGMIAVRGKNNGTWTAWKTIIDSSTIGSQSVSFATSATQVVTIQDNPPTGVNGKLWWESDTGKLKVYYGTSSAWVDATPVPDMSLYYAKAGGPISGDVTIQQTLTVVGNTLVQGTLTETSDISLKENILPLESSLDKVMKLNGVSFNKKATPNVKEIGFIAQEVEAVIPDLVTETSEGIKTVSYSRVTAVLVETIKEQQAQIEELKNMVNLLAEKLNSL